MTIWINQKKHHYNDSITIFQLLKLLNNNKSGIAIAVNNNVIPKNKWDAFYINNEDKITIITATQGG
ncbi:MAG: sulfur carrier protein ThiS [Saprospiraceae bacterium]|nr:sulfur carrier protein ThiS [Saprospiraceae bacterium]